MCVAPIPIFREDYPVPVRVPCKRCRLCLQNRLQDFIGRAIAESRTASRTLALTLTYAGDTPSAVVLSYRDVQLFLMKLRKAGYKVRYICCGEYGTRKGRAHWHVILFFYGSSPEVQLDQRVRWKYWPHGLVYFQQPDYNGFRYVLKYALKQQRPEVAVKRFSLSKYPPLGHEYFMTIADEMVRQKLAFHQPTYSFIDERTYNPKDGRSRPRLFWWAGATAFAVMRRYVLGWRDRYGTLPPDTDYLMERYFARVARAEDRKDPVVFLEFVKGIAASQMEMQRLKAKAEDDAEPYLAFACLPPEYGLGVLHKDGTLRIVPPEGEEWLLDVGHASAGKLGEHKLRLQAEALGFRTEVVDSLVRWAGSFRHRFRGTSIDPEDLHEGPLPPPSVRLVGFRSGRRVL